MTARRASLFAPAILTALLGAAAGCDGAAAREATSAVQLSLRGPGDGLIVAAVSWVVLGGDGEVLTRGSADTSDPNAVPTVLIEVSAGSSEQVIVTATLSNGATCTGTSEPFPITAGQRVNVSLMLACGTFADDGLGSLLISTDLVPGDHCPVLTDWSISSSSAAPSGKRFGVSVTATDADGDPVGFAWTSTSGTFVDATASSTTYLCQASGNQTVMVTLSDDHRPVPCTSLVRLPALVCP